MEYRIYNILYIYLKLILCKIEISKLKADLVPVPRKVSAGTGTCLERIYALLTVKGLTVQITFIHTLVTIC